MKSWHLVIDVEKCENCNNCFLSCKDEHVNNDWPGYAAPQPGRGPSWISIEGVERGQHPFIDVAYLPVTCMHCTRPVCVKSAEEGAIYRRPDGIVIIDPVKARGQSALVEACPYGVIRWNEDLQVAQKCTLCAHLLDEGWTQTRCTQSCPTGALAIKYVEDGEMQEIIAREKLESYRPEHDSNPSVYYKNLYRFTRCFIGGSLAVKIDAKDECAEGAKVNLLDESGKVVGETVSDSYGDFKFDNLVENSGKYTLQFDLPGHNRKTVEVDLAKSKYIGIIFL
jgi:Fe-S-cluster-containing dehydrogenase component